MDSEENSEGLNSEGLVVLMLPPGSEFATALAVFKGDNILDGNLIGNQYLKSLIYKSTNSTNESVVASESLQELLTITSETTNSAATSFPQSGQQFEQNDRNHSAMPPLVPFDSASNSYAECNYFNFGQNVERSFQYEDPTKSRNTRVPIVAPNQKFPINPPTNKVWLNGHPNTYLPSLNSRNYSATQWNNFLPNYQLDNSVTNLPMNNPPLTQQPRFMPNYFQGQTNRPGPFYPQNALRSNETDRVSASANLPRYSFNRSGRFQRGPKRKWLRKPN